MFVNPDKLSDHLERNSLARAYLVFGDEPLQIMESADQVRLAARKAGIAERILFDVESGFDWQQLRSGASEMSLFAEQRLLEVRLNARKPDKAGSAILLELLERDDLEDILLVTAGRLDRNAQKAKWCSAFEKHGVSVQAKQIKPGQLETWIRSRGTRHGLSLSDAAAELVAVRAEGNLLAAAQELDKLSLLVDKGEVDVETVLNAMVDNARYDVFGLIDVTLGGDGAKSIRMLRGLREEGTEAVVIGWALNRELRGLASMSVMLASGKSMQSVLNEHNVWSTRSGIVGQALRRSPVKRISQLFEDSMRLDRVIKGALPGNPWDELELLCLGLASGQRLSPLTN